MGMVGSTDRETINMRETSLRRREENRSFFRPRRRILDKIRMIIKETGYGMDSGGSRYGPTNFGFHKEAGNTKNW